MQTQINLRTLNAVSIVASKEETRFYLQGVLVQCRADHVVYVATDGHRMMVARHDVGENEVPNTLIGDFSIPTAVCRAFKPPKRIREPEVANLSQQGTELRLGGPESVQVFKPIDGSFPDYARVIPGDLSGMTDYTGPKEGAHLKGTSFNPAYMSDFVKIGEIMGVGKPLLAYNSSSPAGVVFVDNHALGVLMPMRSATQPDLQARWAVAKAFILRPSAPAESTTKEEAA